MSFILYWTYTDNEIDLDYLCFLYSDVDIYRGSRQCEKLKNVVVAQIMRKLAGAKDKMGLRVHGLIVGSPEKKRSDPAVLRSICSSILPSGKSEVGI